LCREHVVDVRDEYERFQHAGGQVVAVTMGSSSQAADFRHRLNLPFDCLADPERSAYRAYEIPQARMSQIAGTRVWGAGLRALLRGGVGRPVGDVKQLQAEFVVDRDGIVRWAQRGETSADITTNDRLIEQLRQLHDS
jgi:peroxiredoxin